MKFIVDAQLPPALADWLREQGEEARHVRDLDLLTASDADIRRRAVADGAVVVTKGRDFADAAVKADASPPVLWLRLGNARTAMVKAKLGSIWPSARLQLANGARVVQVR